jgi:sulfatase modifying factor 1
MASPSRLMLGACVLVGCAGAPPSGPKPVQEPGAATRPMPPDSLDGGISLSDASSEQVSGDSIAQDSGMAEPRDAGTGPLPEAGSACPAGMKLVDGDYCTKIEQKCQKSWYDPSNKKTVCERFEAPSRCVGERVHKRFCIDTYEWPNRAGERPEVMNIFYQAELKCAAVGKRLCTESEWTMACEGPDYRPFPYGYARDANKCNGDRMWDGPDMPLVAKRDPKELARLWQGVRSGSQPECISGYGVSDMPANADEVVSSETFTADFRGKFDSVHTGGPWYRGVRNQCRPKIYTHDEGFYYYFLSFRCCAEAEGKATDFRTARQRRENWKLDRLERLAGWTLSEVKEKLRAKASGQGCGCERVKGDRQRIKCKTICGELLGPDAQDAVRGPAGAPTKEPEREKERDSRRGK